MTEEEKKKSLRYSLLDGIFASIKSGFTVSYITPFAVALRANNFQIAVLSSFANLFASFLQLGSVTITEKLKNRVKVCSYFVYAEALCWIPILLIPFLFNKYRITLLIIFFILQTMFSVATLPPWASVMADTVPEGERGKYFGWRSKILGIITLIIGFIGGAILYLVPEKQEFVGFAIIFGVSALARLISGYFLSKMYEPGITIKESDSFSYWAFIKRARESNFVRFVIYVSLLYMATYIAVPFFAVYMLRDLKLDYMSYTLLNVVGSIASFLPLSFWGHYCDRVGNVKIMRIASLFIPVVAPLWIVSTNIYYLAVINIVAGYIWAGFGLATFNFVADAVSPEKRTRCIAYFNLTNGVAIFVGALIGGYLVNVLPPIKGYNILTIFLVSGILRLVVISLFLPAIKEVRKVEHIGDRELLYQVIGLKPMLSFARGIVGWGKD